MLIAARPAVLDEEGQRGFGTAAGVDPQAERELGVAWRVLRRWHEVSDSSRLRRCRPAPIAHPRI